MGIERTEILKKQGFLRSSVILVATVIITKILGLIYKIPLTNILGGSGTGYFSSAYAVFMPMFAIAVSGIPSAMARMVSENAAFDRWQNVRKIRRAARLSFSLTGIFFTLLTLILAYPICVYIIKEPAALWSVIAIAPCILLGAIMAVERGYYEGLRNMTPTAVSEVTEGVFKVFLGLGLAYKTSALAQSSYEATGKVFGTVCQSSQDAVQKALPFVAAAAVFGATLANALACIFLVIIYKIKGDGITPQMLAKDRCTDRTFSLFRQLVQLVIPIAVASVITTLTSAVDLITINRSLEAAIGKDELFFISRFGPAFADNDLSGSLPNFIYGSYTGLAVTVFGLVPSLTSIFGKSIFPAVSEEWSRGNSPAVSKHINSALFMTASIAVPAGMGIFVFSEEILLLLFPERQAEIIASCQSLQIMSAGMIFLALTATVFSILQAIGKARIPVKITLAACAVKMLLNILLVSVPHINISGAAVATTVSYGIMFIWSFAELLKITNADISYDKLFLKTVYSAVMCAATAKLAYIYLQNRLLFPFSLLVSIASGGIIYIYSLYLLSVLNKNELKTLFSK